jgi:hypothetical protein
LVGPVSCRPATVCELSVSARIVCLSMPCVLVFVCPVAMHQVSEEDGDRYCTEQGVAWCEVSAKTGAGVQYLFARIGPCCMWGEPLFAHPPPPHTHTLLSPLFTSRQWAAPAYVGACDTATRDPRPPSCALLTAPSTRGAKAPAGGRGRIPGRQRLPSGQVRAVGQPARAGWKRRCACGVVGLLWRRR